ncbi:glycoside hydrolase family 3 C-terminal domain-containing protein [Branchiibius sp. NY16-3462-2]|uniref:glycoside hydrolase family 3 C-terminal domain-containing protein n=1 Tax=Branchiibius sp. NY16-3462-2 TaxID=1807500 RepID=UPI0007932879|nr:glycoside hydrolase family 3 C-terminal domain-containing protein [Branchiibius sp. NY16-3462-2]KYH46038.1 glycosyl hydrolase [Branchiibius sp. NY16-3462-2]
MNDIELTLQEKADLTSGSDLWHTTAIERAGIPALMLTDGPHGLRKQRGDSSVAGLADSVPATCFPPAVGLGCSYDPDLARRVGVALGVESAIEDVAVILGPGINIKRSPLGGRNFEYYSEDPLVAGVMGAALVEGIQSQGVGASLKHFAVNNQETDRMRVSADVDPRPLHEIYLRGFHRVVTQAKPWTLMCSYNRINGTYSSENEWLLTTLLRDQWGFDGLVMSDWGAVNDRVAGLPAGLDLEMPSSGGQSAARLVAAVEAGTLAETAVDTAAGRVLDLVRKAGARPAAAGPLDVDEHHALAREAAARSIVLLKNDNDLLPLDRTRRVAVIGAFAQQPRYQGAGSSLINPTRLDNALDQLQHREFEHVSYAAGFDLKQEADAEALRAEAVSTAADADVAVVFLGLPAEEESEGFDRTHIDLPADQLELLDAVVAANPDTVVVLSNGGVVALPFDDKVPAIIEGWLLGQGGGSAIADVLVGDINPSGKLTETIPLRLADNPSYDNFPGSGGHVRYGEGIFVGYRGYDHRDLPVAYPFGHGLSYTTFEYGEPTVELDTDGAVVVTVQIRNTGSTAGREVVQAYVSLANSAVERAPRELKGFASAQLQPGESAPVHITIPRDDLAYWDVRLDRFVVEGGDYEIAVGSSSRDLRGSSVVTIEGDADRVPLTMNSSLEELLAHPVAGPIVREAAPVDQDTLTLMGSLPIGRLTRFPGVPVTQEMIEQLIAVANGDN